ncbi:sugar porter family MFS transporter [Nocardia vinacea]|uniref:Sugar porter family MFS transporter n=1 Tax=Nocardia vinacea TaxID=96468 RepID=A0ABZ1Z1J2_9NOCA|nr:hypothetical protein [Nocardia vinacea]
MICATYLLSGVLLFLSAWAFAAGILNAVTQTLLWCVIFFFASAGASSAYLTVSEIFPIELRGQAISFFFAIAQGCGGVIAPFLFGHLVGDADSVGLDRIALTVGYLIGAGAMIFGGAVARFFGVNAEGRSLEDIADPLSKADHAAGVVSRHDIVPGGRLGGEE